MVDKINRVPWKINTYVMSIAEQIWDRGGGRGKIPLHFDNNPSGDSKNQLFNFHFEEASLFQKNDVQYQIQRQKDMISMRADFLLKLQVAKSFSNVKVPFLYNFFDILKIILRFIMFYI